MIMSNGNDNGPSFRGETGDRWQPGSRMGAGQRGVAGEGNPGDDMEGLQKTASRAGEKLMNTAEHQKRIGADYVDSVADAVRRAASEFDEQIPLAGEYIRSAADQMQTMADSVRRRDLKQMLSDVKSFARGQPTAFLGASFFAGFAAVRFLRSSSGGSGGNRQRREPADDGRYGTSSAARMAAPETIGELGS
jgi:hypothetical protein